MKFTGKTALITGAAVGIGRATAMTMAESGANLILCDTNYGALQKVKQELAAFDDRTLIFDCDITDEDRVKETVAEGIKRFGGVDILVNNAALWRSWKPFTQVPAEEWKRFLDVNVMGTVYVTKAVLPGMLERHYGRIINVASVAGVYGNANMVHYSATKGAIIAMTKALAKEVTGEGVLVNAVSPGSVSPSENGDIRYSEKSELAFAGRTGTDRENAELICFLASDEASYISGQNIQIDGCRRKM